MLQIVQIMIGGIYIMLGISMAIYPDSIGVYSGILFWGGIIVSKSIAKDPT